MIGRGKLKYVEETYFSATTLSIINVTFIALELNLGLHGENPATNLLGISLFTEMYLFMMQQEEEDHLPLLDINIYRSLNGFVGHRVYRKPTHTMCCLNTTSHHYPAQKFSILSTLTHRQAFKDNGYSFRQIHRVFHPRRRPNKAETKLQHTSIAFFPYIHSLLNCIERILAQHNIKSINFPPPMTCSVHRQVKDNLG